MIKRTRMRILQSYAARFFAVVTVLLIADSLFLYSSLRADSLLAFAARLHVILGFILCFGLVAFALPHVILHRRHANVRARRIGIALLSVTVVASVLGVILHFTAVEGSRWLMPGHQLLFLIAMAGYLAHRLAARTTPVLRQEFAGAVVVLLLFLGLRVASGPDRRDAGTARTTIGAAADFGASNARTITGHWLGADDLANPQYCAQCHIEIAAQWEGSAHRFSSLNDPFYLATFESLQRNRHPTAAKFCGGCHDPLVMHTGNMEAHVTLETPNATQGITCLACHAITAVPDRLGNGGYVVAAPEHYPFYGSSDPDEQEQNRRLIRAKPEQHKASFMKPEFRTSEFCLACHKAHLDVAVNNYRWKRGQNDYDAWFESAVAGKSARTFYTAPELKRCQDCHMPDVATNDPAAKDGKTRDHTFAGANTALAQFTGNAVWMEKTQKMLQDCVSVDILAAVQDADLPGERRVYPLEDRQVRFPAGKRIRCDVVVRNRKVGHMFPGGTADLNEPWLEFVVSRPNGTTLFASGLLDELGRLDPAAHRFQVVLLTREGRKVDIHDVEDFYTVLYNNSLMLGASDVVRYEFLVPDELAGSTLQLTARLRYRKFSREYTEFAQGPDAPIYPIVDVGKDVVEVRVGSSLTGPADPQAENLWMRVNDYGVAHFRQGDMRVARWAFLEVARLRDDYADAHINLARVDLVEGTFGRMEESLREADRIQPGLAKTAYFLGRLRAAQGKFADAVEAYDRTLAEFPEDREVLLQKGIALYKNERAADAVAAFQAVLATDAENVVAHSYLSRCYQATGDRDAARKHESHFMRYRTEDAERVVTEVYRRNNADANREANAQHVHVLDSHVPAAPRTKPSSATAATATGALPE